jgi:aryl sulfotransferase
MKCRQYTGGSGRAGPRCAGVPAVRLPSGVVRRYPGEHNERWEGFEHRRGDVVISTRSKCGTTWLQMITLMLIHRTSDLPDPVSEMSPWLDWEVEPIEAVRRRLASQGHRRVIKTHTPLDGLPLDDRVTYLVAGRRPLDVALSQYHHSRNIDRARVAELTGSKIETSPTEPFGEWLDGWIAEDWEAGRLDSLSGLAHHIVDARTPRPGIDVHLVHFDDLVSDLDSEMRRIASWLDIEVDPGNWRSLVDAATFSSMSSRPNRTAPDALGVLLDRRAFFRAGRVGDGDLAASSEQRSQVRHRLRELADGGTCGWLLRSRDIANG